ncbi:MAG: PilZ domain-containing protein [Desulfobacterales bacterium]|jgi:hypothetical protein
MKIDQRTYIRRIPVGNVYTALGPDYEKVGKLIDLSRGGLAFEYISNENKETVLTRVNIFKVGEVFNLHNLPCKVVYDTPIPPARDGIQSLKYSHNRRCGIQFDMLPKEDRVQLAMFIESHTKSKLY